LQRTGPVRRDSAVEFLRIRSGDDLRLRSWPFSSGYRNSDAVNPVESGPSVDAAPVVTDLNAPLPRLNGLDQVDVDVSGDLGQNDVANFDPSRVRR
jgi:hypothetical protein